MARYSESTGRTRRVILQPAITRAYWSRERAFHGDELTLFVETRNVPDDTPLKIQIWEDDSAEGTPDDFITEVEGDHKVTNNRCAIPYTLRWDEGTLGEPLALEGNELEFYFKVSVEKFKLQHRSTLLYVDLHRYVASS